MLHLLHKNTFKKCFVDINPTGKNKYIKLPLADFSSSWPGKITAKSPANNINNQNNAIYFVEVCIIRVFCHVSHGLLHCTSALNPPEATESSPEAATFQNFALEPSTTIHESAPLRSSLLQPYFPTFLYLYSATPSPLRCSSVPLVAPWSLISSFICPTVVVLNSVVF